jgi:hypothetical protein
MGIHHYIVDVWVEDDAVTEDQLDTAIGETVEQLGIAHNLDPNGLTYDLVDMGEEDEF